MAIFQKQHKINMGKYIDADKLITEIERLQHLNECYKRNWRWKFKWFSRTVIGRMEVLEGIKNLITSLQQEQQEVDLEKEIDACWQNWISPSNQSSVEGVLPKSEFSMYARHFYELGLNARKEEANESTR